MRIMILTAATGGGHIRAASAVEQYIRNHTDHDVLTVDTLKAIGRFLDKTVCDSYLFMARKAPVLFGTLYKRTNRESRFSDLVPKLNSALSHPLIHTIRQYMPDVIITTHPFATEMVSYLKEIGDTAVPLVCLITDYGLHRAWVADEVNAYVVACRDMIPQLLAAGVDEEIIHPFGIPVHQEFFAPRDQAALRRELGLRPDLPTITFMAGSFGVTNIVKLYRDLISCGEPMQVIIITGRNQKLYEAFERELEEEKGETQVPTKLILFTTEVEKYMHVSDLLITKPGGLTVSEALACNLPLAVFDAIPGQEEDNAAFLEQNNMGIRIIKTDRLSDKIHRLLSDPTLLESMRESCRKFDKSQSVPKMLEICLKLADENDTVKEFENEYQTGNGTA